MTACVVEQCILSWSSSITRSGRDRSSACDMSFCLPSWRSVSRFPPSVAWRCFLYHQHPGHLRSENDLLSVSACLLLGWVLMMLQHQDRREMLGCWCAGRAPPQQASNLSGFDKTAAHPLTRVRNGFQGGILGHSITCIWWWNERSRWTLRTNEISKKIWTFTTASVWIPRCVRIQGSLSSDDGPTLVGIWKVPLVLRCPSVLWNFRATLLYFILTYTLALTFPPEKFFVVIFK